MYVAAWDAVNRSKPLMYSAQAISKVPCRTANRLFKIIEEEPDFEETKDQFVENLERCA